MFEIALNWFHLAVFPKFGKMLLKKYHIIQNTLKKNISNSKYQIHLVKIAKIQKIHSIQKNFNYKW